MKRPRIEIPERFPHETRLRVRISDVNYGGHLGNDALHGDEVILRTAPAELARTGFRLVHQVVHAETGREIARAAIGLAFSDYAADRPARMPESFRERICDWVLLKGHAIG